MKALFSVSRSSVIEWTNPAQKWYTVFIVKFGTVPFHASVEESVRFIARHASDRLHFGNRVAFLLPAFLSPCCLHDGHDGPVLSAILAALSIRWFFAHPVLP